MYLQTHLRCPFERLPTPLLGALNYVCQQAEVPPEIALADIFALLSSVIQRHFKAEGLNGNLMPLSMNTLSLAPTGCGKGQSFQLTLQAGVGIGATHLHSPAEGPTIDDLLLQDVSASSLMAELDGSMKSASIQLEDGLSFLYCPLMKRDAISKLTQLWSGPASFKSGRRNDKKNAIEPCLTIGLRIQPELFYDFLRGDKNKSRLLGLWARGFTFCYDPERFPVTPWQPVPADISDLTAVLDRLHGLLTSEIAWVQSEEASRKVLVMDTDARAHLQHIAYWVKGEMNGQFLDIQDAVVRAAENTLRLAGNFQVACKGEGPISYDMIDRAWAFVQWSLMQYRQVFVLATQPPPKPSKLKQPKPPKIPRHQKNLQDDMQFLLECIYACSRLASNPWVRQQEVAHRIGFSKERFLRTMVWLVDAGRIEVFGDEDNGMIRILPVELPGPVYGNSGPRMMLGW